MLDKAAMAFVGREFHWPQEKVTRALDSAYSVENKESYGAPGPKALGHNLQVLTENLKKDESSYQSLVAAQASANAYLQEEIAALLAE